MVALTIVAVLVAIAAPSYRDFILDTQMSGEANEFLTSVNFARSEAIKRNGRVTMCKSSDGAGCADADSGGWNQGWIVYVDAGAAGVFNQGTDVILRVHGRLTTSSTLVGATDDVATYVSFIQDGRSQLGGGAAQAGNVDLCNTQSSALGRRLTLALGRAQVIKIDTCPV